MGSFSLNLMSSPETQKSKIRKRFVQQSSGFDFYLCCGALNFKYTLRLSALVMKIPFDMWLKVVIFSNPITDLWLSQFPGLVSFMFSRPVRDLLNAIFVNLYKTNFLTNFHCCLMLFVCMVRQVDKFTFGFVGRGTCDTATCWRGDFYLEWQWQFLWLEAEQNECFDEYSEET